jgi:(+)-abscisic acid 8'-hydroxylase
VEFGMDTKTAPLIDDQISDNIIVVIFATQDTTTSILTWIAKYLRDYPSLLEVVTAEQEAIQREKRDGENSLTWANTRRMPMMSRVIQETLRVATTHIIHL